MYNVFLEIELDYYVNLNHVVAVDFTEDDILGDSLLTISFAGGSEYSITLIELVEDNYHLDLILKFLNYLELYKLADTIGSFVHDLLLK